MKSKTIRTFSEPQTFIISTSADGDGDAQITDDYSGYDIYVGDSVVSGGGFESDGFIKLYTISELLQQIKNSADDENIFSDEEDMFDNSVDFVMIECPAGKIGISAIDENGNASDDFDIDDYICHQENYQEVAVCLPEGSVVTRLNKSNFNILIRDNKINTIIQ